MSIYTMSIYTITLTISIPRSFYNLQKRTGRDSFKEVKFKKDSIPVL